MNMSDALECTLTKISRPNGVQGGLRTEEVRGITGMTPVINRPFTMMARSLSDFGSGYASIRVVETSNIVGIIEESRNKWLLTTQSGSKYRLEIQEDIP